MGNLCGARPSNDNDQSQQPSQLKSHKFYDYGIYLDFGDIKNEEVDVIVAQTDQNLRIPKSLLANESYATQQQLNKDIQILRLKSNYANGDVVYTHAAELEFDFVFYCVLPSEDAFPKLKQKDHLPKLSKGITQKYQKQFIYDCIVKCLRLAEELEISSLCFPAMTSSNFSVQTIAAMEMLAVKNYLEESQGNQKFLNSIRFCISDEKDTDSYQWAFEKVFMDTDDNSDVSDDDSLPRKVVEKKKKNEDEDYLGSFGASYYDKVDSLERKLSI